ncbi:MAG: FKBP-type peptidyl-prolyl cis-trans isomerase [Candidatus Saccharibacteria bacterium]|nr:FKBP-type peptidyl-prolyl cis-trans isomerase [Candidatus Saccharibacteria bacterium]
MEEKELKTSLKQRIFISVIAIVMVGTFIASYAAILMSGNSSSSGSSETEGLSDERMAYYEQKYYTEVNEFKTATAGDYAIFAPYLSEITAYNETAANDNGVVSRDLLVGSGRELAEGDKDYLAYYVGWCADETIFDSSLDSATNPAAFASALDASSGLIEGWETGIVGMKIGGVREITIPGNLAYGEQSEICGGYNKPLKFIVMTKANEEPFATQVAELQVASMMLQYAYYGVDYEVDFQTETSAE